VLYFFSALRFAARKPAAQGSLHASVPSTYETARARNTHVLPQRTGLLSVVPCRGLGHRYSHITALLKILNSTAGSEY